MGLDLNTFLFLSFSKFLKGRMIQYSFYNFRELHFLSSFFFLNRVQKCCGLLFELYFPSPPFLFFFIFIISVLFFSDITPNREGPVLGGSMGLHFEGSWGLGFSSPLMGSCVYLLIEWAQPSQFQLLFSIWLAMCSSDLVLAAIWWFSYSHI